MVHDVSDIVSTDPQRFKERNTFIYEVYKSSIPQMMGMAPHILQLFERGSGSAEASRRLKLEHEATLREFMAVKTQLVRIKSFF